MRLCARDTCVVCLIAGVETHRLLSPCCLDGMAWAALFRGLQAIFSHFQMLQKAKSRFTLCVPWQTWAWWCRVPSPLFLLFPVPSSPPSPPAQVEVLSQRVKQCPPMVLPGISSHSWNWDYPIPTDLTKPLAAARNRTRVLFPSGPSLLE